MRSYVALGSNLKQPLKQIQQALQELGKIPQTLVAGHSPLYSNPAMQIPDAPPQPDYINAVAAIDTELSPYALLRQLQNIEQSHGRVRNGVRWAARTLDLDIVLYGTLQMNTAQLTLPHPGLAQRAFVLYPLHECAPDLCLPDGTPLSLLLTQCPSHHLKRLENT